MSEILVQQIAFIGHQKLRWKPTELNGTQRNSTGRLQKVVWMGEIGTANCPYWAPEAVPELNGTQREGSKKWVWMGEIGTTNCPYWAPEPVPELNGTQREGSKKWCGWVKLAQQIAHIGRQKLCRNSMELNRKAPKQRKLNGKAPKSGCGWVKLADQMAHLGHQKLTLGSGSTKKSFVEPRTMVL